MTKKLVVGYPRTRRTWTIRDWVRQKLGHPSPDEIAEAKERMRRYNAIIFEIDLGTGWRQICIGNHMPLYNPVKPELSLLVFRALPVIVTPYLSKIEGQFFITLDGLTKGIVTWISLEYPHFLLENYNKYSKGSIECKFRCVTEEAGMWLHRELAKACGMRFAEHDLAGNVVYTREP